VDLDRPVVRRRRGAVLEDALLDSAWEELFESGYAALTIDAVAQRAGTSRTVIYRRWATKAELVRAAVRRAQERTPIEAPDTGSLRGDLLALARQANKRSAPFSATLTYHLGPYFQETGTTPAELREVLVGDRMTLLDVVLERAAERGEVDPARLSPRVRSVPFDLFRHEALMTLAPVPDAVIEEIVDEVFLPLVGAAQEQANGRAATGDPRR
jgi:AcrR family transcriptional regulator